MLQTNVICFGWNRPIPGREGLAAELFAHTTTYLERCKTNGTIENWEPVFLASHGGDFNGFFYVKGSYQQLSTLRVTDEWVDIVLRANQYLQGVGVIDGYCGNAVPELMNRWTKTIPSR